MTAVALALGLTQAGTALALITYTDNGDGSFDSVGYGSNPGIAFVTPLLFASDFGTPTMPAATQVSPIKNGVAFSYTVGPQNKSRVEIDYTLHSVRTSLDTFPTVHGLRLMVDVLALGIASPPSTDRGTAFFPAKAAGDPDNFQIQAITYSGGFPDPTTYLTSVLASANQVDGVNHCPPVAGCTTDLALEWDRAALGPGETWTVKLFLVDNPSLVSGGGRYLQATSLDGPDTTLIFGNPTFVPEPGSTLVLLAGLGMLGLLYAQRQRRLS